jgi:hypothetical protein
VPEAISDRSWSSSPLCPTLPSTRPSQTPGNSPSSRARFLTARLQGKQSFPSISDLRPGPATILRNRRPTAKLCLRHPRALVNLAGSASRSGTGTLRRRRLGWSGRRHSFGSAAEIGFAKVGGSRAIRALKRGRGIARHAGSGSGRSCRNYNIRGLRHEAGIERSTKQESTDRRNDEFVFFHTLLLAEAMPTAFCFTSGSSLSGKRSVPVQVAVNILPAYCNMVPANIGKLHCQKMSNES